MISTCKTYRIASLSGFRVAQGVVALTALFHFAGTNRLFAQHGGDSAITTPSEQNEAAEVDEGQTVARVPEETATGPAFIEPLEKQSPSDLDDRLLDRTRRQTLMFQRLAERISMEFPKIPLSEALRDLDDRTGFDIVMDTEVIESAGIDPNTPVTLTLNDVRLDEGLEMLLAQVHLAFYPKENILLITTNEEAASKVMTRVMNVRHLLPKDAGHNAVSWLTSVVTGTVASDSWEEFGGAGRIHSYHGFLFVTNTYPVIRDVEYSLADLTQGLAQTEGLIARHDIVSPQQPRMCRCQFVLPEGQGMGIVGLGGGMFQVDADDAHRTDTKPTMIERGLGSGR